MLDACKSQSGCVSQLLRSKMLSLHLLKGDFCNSKSKRNPFFNYCITSRWNLCLSQVNFILIKALIELLQRKISLKCEIPHACVTQ